MLKEFMGGAGEDNVDDGIEDTRAVQKETPPIADLFPNATIMFAGMLVHK